MNTEETSIFISMVIGCGIVYPMESGNTNYMNIKNCYNFKISFFDVSRLIKLELLVSQDNNDLGNLGGNLQI